ncbi:MAG: hypothetical protein Q7O66_07210 [Dehalococcoidia bacterium]|nr:hypothetical protein [Dehalococcoidia bacterium]
MRPVLLDAFCKAGGTTRGYQLAGFYVVGLDIEPQPHYIGDEFVQADALSYLATADLSRYDAIHASPPCQHYTVARHIHGGEYPDLIAPVRELLLACGLPYVIENVPSAPLIAPLMLCGSMFPGLRVYRHRLFECSWPIGFAPAACNHSYSMPPSKGHYHTLEKQDFITCVGHNFKASDGRIAMNIPWMSRAELSQAIPPAYCEFIGRALLREIGR